jgi:outer membrane lipoprotein SlyB
MDWSSLAPTLIKLGAPLIGEAIGGPFGATAGKILADALGAPAPTPPAVQEAISRTDATEIAARLQEAEEKWAAALAEIGKSQLAEVGQTQRAEIASEDALQRWWRPLYALELSLLECPAFALTVLHALWTGHEAGIAGFASLSGLLITYFGARFGVLGVYVTGRTREKQAATTGAAVPSVIGEVVKAVVRRK